MQKGTRTDDKNNSALRTKLGVELRKHRERTMKPDQVSFCVRCGKQCDTHHVCAEVVLHCVRCCRCWHQFVRMRGSGDGKRVVKQVRQIRESKGVQDSKSKEMESKAGRDGVEIDDAVLDTHRTSSRPDAGDGGDAQAVRCGKCFGCQVERKAA